MFAHTITPNSITVFLDNAVKTVNSSHANFAAVKRVLSRLALVGTTTVSGKMHMEELKELLDLKRFIVKASCGRVQLGENEVRFDGKPIHGVIAERLLMLLRDGQDIQPLCKFLDRLQLNPLQSARDEMFLFLEVSKLPFTSDGCFLAYKSVKDDYTSHYDGKTLNRIGDTPSVPRDECDTDRHNTCSRGLHFCAFDYLGTYAGDRRIMVCKVKPEDVTAIPSDYNNMKGRAWTYEIVAEIPREDDAKAHLTDKGFNDDYDGGTRADTGSTEDEGYYDPERYQGVEEEEIDDGPVPLTKPYTVEDRAQQYAGYAAADTSPDSAFAASPTIADALTYFHFLGTQEDIDAAVDAELADIPNDPNAPECDCDTVCKGVVKDCLLFEDPTGNPVPPVPTDFSTPKFASAPAPKKTRPVGTSFEHNGIRYRQSDLKKLIAKFGINGTAREKNIPRSTLQGWVKRFT